MYGKATCHFLGRLTAKPKLYEGEGKGGYAYFELAINYPGVKGQDGTFKPGKVEYPRFSINGLDAKYLCKNGEPGDVVYVETDIRITSRSVEKDGKTTVYNDPVFPVKHGSLNLISINPTTNAEFNNSGKSVNATDRKSVV